MKKARIFAFVMLVVLAVSFSACALAGTQAYNFNLRAVSSGLTGFRGSKNDDEARFYVTQTSATPESAYPNATWEKTLYRATWLDSGAVASNTLTLTSNTSSSASYTDTVDTGDSFKLNLRLRTLPLTKTSISPLRAAGLRNEVSIRTKLNLGVGVTRSHPLTFD